MLWVCKSFSFPTITEFLISNIFKSDKYWQLTWTIIKAKKINIRFQYILLAIVYTIKYCGHVHVNLCSIPGYTQSCIKGLLVVRDFCFWAVWVAGPVHKKKLAADYEQLLRALFSFFSGSKKKIFLGLRTFKIFELIS